MEFISWWHHTKESYRNVALFWFLYFFYYCKFVDLDLRRFWCVGKYVVYLGGFVARSISRLPSGGPGIRSTVNPMCCRRRRISPLAQ